MRIIRILITNVIIGVLIFSGYYLQDPDNNANNSNYVNNHKQKELASLNKQLKEISEQFSKQEEGIDRKIILKGKYIQYIPDIIKQKSEYYFNPDNYIFIHDIDMNLALDNLNSSTDNPTIYIIGNKIYKQQEKSKDIYYKKVLKVLCSKKLNSNNTDWTLYPQDIENWQLKIDNEKKLRRTYYGSSISVDDEEIYNISCIFALENAIYKDIESMYYNNDNEKKKVDHFIEQNFDLFINKINEYLKTFSKTERGIKELRIIAKYNQIIPFEEFDTGNYIKVYSSLYNIYLDNSNPTIHIIGKKTYSQQHHNKNYNNKIYNKSLILDVMKKGCNDKENNTEKLDIRISTEKIIPEQTPTLHTIRDCDFFKIDIGSYEIVLFSQYKFLEDIYNKMKEAQKNQELINKLVEINAEPLFIHIKNIIKHVCSNNNETKPYNKIYVFGEYKQVFELDELEDKLKNTKILRNPFKNYLKEYDLYQNPDNINYMYPLIYNLYLSKTTPIIRFYYKNKYMLYPIDTDSPPTPIEYRPDYKAHDIPISNFKSLKSLN